MVNCQKITKYFWIPENPKKYLGISGHSKKYLGILNTLKITILEFLDTLKIF